MRLSPNDMPVVTRVLDDIRGEFAVREAYDFTDKLRQVFNIHLQDVLARLQEEYENEAVSILDEMAARQ